MAVSVHLLSIAIHKNDDNISFFGNLFVIRAGYESV